MKTFYSNTVAGLLFITATNAFTTIPSFTLTTTRPSLVGQTTAIFLNSIPKTPHTRLHEQPVKREAEEAPPQQQQQHYTIETSNSGPNGSTVHTLTFHHIPGVNLDTPPIVLETGKIARQAAGSIQLTRGDTVLLATAARDTTPKDNIDFLPLSVEHQERFSSAGLTSGAFNKRDGRPAEHEILTCRLVDRPLRPLIASGWRHETQLLSWVLSYDGVRSCDPLAIVASSTALYLSDVPLCKPVAAVQVGLCLDSLVVNPTHEQMKTSRLHLIVAGTVDGVLMIEGEADFLPESTFLEAVAFGHQAVKVLCQGIQEWGDIIGITKKVDTLILPPDGLQERVNELFTDRVDEFYAAPGTKDHKGELQSKLQAQAVQELSDEFPEEITAIKSAFKELLCDRMFVYAKQTGKRNDGRTLNAVRNLDMQTRFLPSVHGSALFTRGETQTIATATLGDAGMRQKIDKISGMEEKRFYLQYTFPPSCVGETGRVGAPGRREVGHGNLAERALLPTLPSEEDFPYTIRVESLITESHGSSSMASVCGGCLALMDAGVPIKNPIAGIAMGMLLDNKAGVSDDNAIVLSDITGTEDAFGTMDFKVAGDRDGITTFQLDIKCEGLTLETMARALEQAREGRLHILDEMEKVIAGPGDLPESVPKMSTFDIPADSIGKVIGPGGKQIRAIIEDFELVNMNVGEEGGIQISAFNQTQMALAEAFVKNLVSGPPGGGRGERRERPQYSGPEPVEGQVYTGKVKGIHQFGVFVEILPGAEDGSTPGFEGLVHVSELARDRVRNCEGFMRSLGTDELTVKYLGKDRGKAKLSRKAVLEDTSNKNRNGGKAKTPAEMPQEELDVIVQAIEDI